MVIIKLELEITNNLKRKIMIDIKFAREQSSMPVLKPVINYEEIIDVEILKAMTDRKFEVCFKYDEDLHNCLLQYKLKYKEYKIKINYTQGFRDGGYPDTVKISWFPKQVSKQ